MRARQLVVLTYRSVRSGRQCFGRYAVLPDELFLNIPYYQRLLGGIQGDVIRRGLGEGGAARQNRQSFFAHSPA
jgi:hypothetical protein